MKKPLRCPVQATANVMAGKWKVLIVWHLSFGSRRFVEIRDFLPGASEKVLTAQLRELQHDEVIERKVTLTVPSRVDYQLTDRGKELVFVMEAMCAWSMKHLGMNVRFGPWENPDPYFVALDLSTVRHPQTLLATP